MPPAAVLAGGLGTRLGALAADRPKALVEVAGEPFIAHQLRLLAAKGVRRAVLCVGHHGAALRDFVGDGSRYGLETAFSEDGPTPLGTGGALKKALPLLGPAFWVTYGDAYLDTDYAAVLRRFEDARPKALMTVYRNEGRWVPSNARLEGGRVAVYDKADRSGTLRHVDYGLLLLTPAALAGLPDGAPADLAGALKGLAAAGELLGFEVAERFYEVGTPEGLARTAERLKELKR
jgi:NDP-sugar pyrophosphorylase family protein